MRRDDREAAAAYDGRHRGSPRPVRQSPAADNPAFRPDVQGLRAVAVLLVVLYHLYPGRIPGGYVGVDVFFVISGYLITGHLLRGFRRTGRIRMLDFYGRRARRLLPAAAVVLTVTWILSKAVLPATRLPAAAEQIRASALYFQNWVLAHNAVDYLTATDAPSPVQHFWSLSVEEQFYLVWPLIFLVAGAVALRRSGRARVVAAAALATGVVVASFVVSVRLTASDPASAYFVTTTRMWELGVGGLLAFLPAAVVARTGRHGWVAWLGAAAVIGSAFALDGRSAFPGSVAAWPVLGTAAILLCGSRAGRGGPWRVSSSRPFVFVGDISYSLYLWHWPLIVLWTSWSGNGIGVLDGPAILAVSIVLAWLTKVLVEDRVRTASFVTARTWRSLATATTVLVPVVAVAFYSTPAPYRGHGDRAHPGAAAVAAAASAPASAAAPASASVKKASRIYPPLVDTPTDQPSYGKCEAGMTRTHSASCTFGDTTDPRLTVALVGDSVAAQWFDVLRSIATRQHWKMITYLRQLCTWTDTVISKGTSTTPYDSCHQWGQSATRDLLRLHPDVILVSSRPTMATPDHPHPDAVSWREIARGMVRPWRQLIAHGTRIIALKETPEMGHNVPDCLSARAGSAAKCGTPAARAVLRATPLEQAVRMTGRGAELIDLNRLICSPTVCSPVVGNIYVYRDDHHLTRTYVATMEPYLQQRLLRSAAIRAASTAKPN